MQQSVGRIPLSTSTRSMPCHTVEMIFRQFTCRRAGLIRALTEDEEAFFRKCDTGMRPLCLYGTTDASWEVRQPEPKALLRGINLERKNMNHIKWLQQIAMHCDAWLINVSFSLGQNLKAKERERLFIMMNSLQTVREAFLASDTCHRLHRLEEKVSRPVVEQNKQTEGEDGACSDQIICPICEGHYHANAFWICCDVCDQWYHGKCVKIRAKQADQIKHYECPECFKERSGHA